MMKDVILRFADRRVLVVGDVVLDEYLFGTPTRLSREAPIPVLELNQRLYIPGGAANPTRNICALGAHAAQAGIVGDDAEGMRLAALLHEAGADTGPLLAVTGRVTTTKTRVLAYEPLRFPQQVARIDRLERRVLDSTTEERLIGLLSDAVPNADVVLCSDYRQGLMTPRLTGAVHTLCRRHGILLTVDAQGGAELYQGVDLFRCNLAEAAAIVGQPLQSSSDVRSALETLRERLGVRQVIVTRGPDGLALLGEQTPYTELPAANRSEVYDTTGAGDTFIAVATLALSVGTSLIDAARLASLAAGLVVRRLGNATISAAELIAVLPNL